LRHTQKKEKLRLELAALYHAKEYALPPKKKVVTT
jgi:hypothetical protein